MAIITISRGSYSRGKEVAERVAQKLGYECVARKVLLEASEEFNVPEYLLVRELHDAPSLFQRFSHKKEKYVSLVRTAFLEHVQKDNVVYHGLAGRVFLPGVSHVLKVRIIADLDDRIREEMRREQLSHEKARGLLLKDDEERRKWSQSLYGTDNRDPAICACIFGSCRSRMLRRSSPRPHNSRCFKPQPRRSRPWTISCSPRESKTDS